MDIRRQADLASREGAAAYFTGVVEITPLQQPTAPSRVAVARVRFAAGARTAWHTHPVGQTLLVVEGTCWAQTVGSDVEELQPGDTVFFAPGEKHWHGASPAAAMTHIAIQEERDGTMVTWLEPVTDAEYRR